jgi:hypothetical protein
MTTNLRPPGERDITTTRTIAARYPGRCQTCGKDYAAGDSITRIGYRKWVHVGCYTLTNGEAAVAVPQASPAAVTPSVSPPRIDDIVVIVRRLLEGAELSVDESEVRQLVQNELAKSGAVQRFEVKLPDNTIRPVQGKPSRTPSSSAPSAWPPHAATSSSSVPQAVARRT